MSKNIKKPTYDDLLIRIQEQESEINRLLKKEQFSGELDFYQNGSRDLVCIGGFDGFFKQINSSFVQILGYTKEELLTNPIITFIHPEDIEKTNQEVLLLSNSRPSPYFENRYINKNCDIVTIQWTIILSPNQDFVYGIGRDISEIKNNQEYLRSAQNLLNEAQKIAKIGSWEFNLADKKMIWSKELYSIYEIEMDPKQNLFQEFINLFSAEDANSFLNKIDQAIVDKKEFEVQQNVVLSNNKNKWLHAIVVLELDDKGNVVTLRGNTQDITEKKLIEQAIKEQEAAVIDYKLKLIEQESDAKFKHYIENAPDGIFVIDQNRNYIEVNQAASTLTGYSAQELLLMKFGDLSSKEHADATLQKFQLLQETGAIKGEIIIIHKNGDELFCFIDVVALSGNRFLGFVKDVTENRKAEEKIKESEKRFRALVENNDSIITVIDENFNTLFRSPSSSRVNGYSHEEYENLTEQEYFHPDYLEYVHEMVQKTFNNPGKPHPVLFQVKHKNGNYIWLQGVLNNMMEHNGVNGIVVNLRDVTESIMANETLSKEK
ncbi:MAG: PAS domain S-box protein, partial [Methylotenera sp.]|nr:PAS domain S-box protein [Flavobacterium sp.]